MFEFQDGDADVFWHIEFIEDFLCVVGAVVVADSGVVSADNEVGDAVILADEGVQDCLAGAGISHGERHYREHGALAVVIIVNEDFVAGHSRVGRDIVGFGFADQGMNQQAVGHF